LLGLPASWLGPLDVTALPLPFAVGGAAARRGCGIGGAVR